MAKKIISIAPVSRSPRTEHDITVRYTPGWFARLFGFTEETTVYRGSATVWHEYPSGKRAPTWLESALADALQGHQYKVPSEQGTS